MLRRAEGYLSGQELCERLEVSRTAIWKTIGQLKEEGYEIDSVQNRGYLLKSSPEVLTQAEVESRLTTEIMGHPLYCYAQTDSTNTRIKLLAEEGGAHGALAVSDQQTGGRGRRGRAWSSPPGEAIYMSLLLRPQIQPEHTPQLTLVMGMAAAAACNDLMGESRVKLKWPNDLVIDGKKAAGILTELSAEAEYVHYAVIGIGINVNTQSFPPELSQAISLAQAAGRTFSRAELVARCMAYFEQYYQRFEETEDFSLLKEAYGRLLVNTGREVRVLDPQGEYTGTALGVDDRGQLLVQCADGHIEAVYAGEVSVRGVYGYV